MHRKFIALILATALAVTGLSAVPARADPDTTRLLAGLAALALIGAAIRSERKKRHVVSRNPTYPTQPTQPRVNRFDLPGQCLRPQLVNGRQRKLFGSRCLKNNYAFVGTLPDICRLGYWDGRRNRIGYEPLCLSERGYRFARR